MIGIRLEKGGVKMARVLRKKAASRKNNKTNLVTFVRYFRYDFGGGGLPLGHDHDDAAELIFGNGRTVWRIRAAALMLHSFVEQHGKQRGDSQSLPYDKDYDSRSYKQEYEFPSEFTHAVVEKLVRRDL